MLTRRSTLAALAAAVAVPRVARAQAQPLRVMRGSVEASAAPYYAESLGIFKKAGLDVNLTIVNSGEVAAAAIVGGSADIGAANVLSIAVAYAKGVPFQLLAPDGEYRATAPIFALVVAKTSPLRGPKDLPGKTVAVTSLGDLNTITTSSWLEKAGVDPASVRFVEVPQPQMTAALERGTVDVVAIGSPALEGALVNGRILGYQYAAIGERFLINAWYARKDWIAAHRDAARKFAQAIIEAQVWANGNREASGKLLADVTKLDPETTAKMTRITFAERFEPALIQPLIELGVHYKQIAASFPATDLYDRRLLG